MQDQEYLSNLEQTQTPETPAPVAEAPAPANAEEMFELIHGDKPMKFPVSAQISVDGKPLPYSKLINSYRMNGQLQNKYNEALKSQESLKPEFEKYKGFYDKYGALQDWSEKNPGDWKIIHDLWKNRDKHLLAAKAGVEQNPNLNPFIDEITGLKAKLSEFEKFKADFDQRQQQELEQKHTQEVKSEMEQFQKDFPDINLQEEDESGVKLYAKILNFGVQYSMPDFEAAALKYLKSRLVDTAKANGRNEALKAVKSDKQQGIVARSPTPFNLGQSAKSDPRKMSWSEIGEAARADYDRLSAQNQ